MAFIFNNISIHLRRFLPQHCGYYYKHLPNPSDHEILISHLRLAAPVFVGSAVSFSDELYHQCYLSEIPVSLRTKALCTAKDDALLCRLYAYDHTFHSGVLHQPAVTVVDQKLYDKGWRFIRNIDDYTCYVETRALAESFIVDLGLELEEFELQLNQKKVEELPDTVLEHWVRKLNGFSLLTSYGKVDYKQARAYFDLAIELMKSSGENASALNYAIKVLSKQALTDNARKYSWKMSMHLCMLYPYLISIMDEYVFKAFDTPKEEIQKFIDLANEDGLEKRNYEECGYAIYFALKHNMDVKSIDSSKVAATNDCVYKLLSYLYFKKKGDSSSTAYLQNDAKNLAKTDCDLDRNWLFVYETLDQQDLVGEWVAMKRHGVSFLKNEFRY